MPNVKESRSGVTLSVECDSGHRAEETPRRFRLGGRALEITEVVDCWPGPDHRYFKVQADDEGIYILRHDLERDEWELTLFSRCEALRCGESLASLRPSANVQ